MDMPAPGFVAAADVDEPVVGAEPYRDFTEEPVYEVTPDGAGLVRAGRDGDDQENLCDTLPPAIVARADLTKGERPFSERLPLQLHAVRFWGA